MKKLSKRLDSVIDMLNKNNLKADNIYFKYNKLNRKRLSTVLWDRKVNIVEFTIGRDVSFVYRGIRFYIED